MSKDTILYTIIEGLHKNPNESWNSYEDRYNIYKSIEKENKIPQWASKRANIIFLKEKRKRNIEERLENENNIRETERFNDNEEDIKKQRRRRWKRNKTFEEIENKEIETAIRELYKDITKLDENNNFLIEIFEETSDKWANLVRKQKNKIEEEKENIPPETLTTIKDKLNKEEIKKQGNLNRYIKH
jgi:hypothetical protein